MVVALQMGKLRQKEALSHDHPPPFLLSVSHLEVLRTTSLKSSVAKKFDLIFWNPLRWSLRLGLVK